MSKSTKMWTFHIRNVQNIYFTILGGSEAVNALMLLVRRRKEHPAHKNCPDSLRNEVYMTCICMAQLMPLPPHHLCFSEIQNGLSSWYRFTRVVLEERPLNDYVGERSADPCKDPRTDDLCNHSDARHCAPDDRALMTAPLMTMMTKMTMPLMTVP